MCVWSNLQTEHKEILLSCEVVDGVQITLGLCGDQIGSVDLGLAGKRIHLVLNHRLLQVHCGAQGGSKAL